MGKIYSYADIRNNLVPSPEGFHTAKTKVMNALTGFVEQGGVYGAKVFGSAAHGTASERSDFDLVVVIERDNIIEGLRDSFSSIYQETSVAIEPIVLSRQFAQRGFHSIDAYFLRHIQSIPSEGNVAGFDPADIITPVDLPMTKVHEQYLAQKTRRLREGIFAYSDSERYKILQRALEAPINVGRRTIQALATLGATTELTDDRKPAVAQRFHEIFDGTPLIPRFHHLLQRDKEYTSLLKATIEGTVPQQEYETTVKSLAQECIPEAFKWTSDLSMIYLRLLEGRSLSVEGNDFSAGNKERFH